MSQHNNPNPLPLLSAERFLNYFSTAFFRINPNVIRRNDRIAPGQYYTPTWDITLPEIKARRTTVEYTTGVGLMFRHGENGNVHVQVKPVDKFEISLN